MPAGGTLWLRQRQRSYSDAWMTSPPQPGRRSMRSERATRIPTSAGLRLRTLGYWPDTATAAVSRTFPKKFGRQPSAIEVRLSKLAIQALRPALMMMTTPGTLRTRTPNRLIFSRRPGILCYLPSRSRRGCNRWGAAGRLRQGGGVPERRPSGSAPGRRLERPGLKTYRKFSPLPLAAGVVAEGGGPPRRQPARGSEPAGRRPGNETGRDVALKR